MMLGLCADRAVCYWLGSVMIDTELINYINIT